MPWKTFEIEDEYCVFKLDADGERTGETLGCHETEAEAGAQVKALYASEESEIMPDSKKSPTKLREYTYTFADLRTQVQTEDAIKEVEDLTYQFRDIAFNILYDADIDKATALEALSGEYIELVKEALGEISESEMAIKFEECDLAESNTGSILSISESQGVEDDEPAPLELEVVVIEPGWGNSKDNHFYSAEMLKEHARVFEGAKMYATDHKSAEKNVLTEVSQVLACPVSFTESGAPIARVGVFDNAFAESIRNRAALGKLEDLHVSILANGTARPYTENGRTGKYVETISAGASVDWVTRAGAGGHALRLAENEQEDTDMPPEAKIEEKEKDQKPEGQEQEVEPKSKIQEGTTEPAPNSPAEPVRLSESEVTEALSASNLRSEERRVGKEC